MKLQINPMKAYSASQTRELLPQSVACAFIKVLAVWITLISPSTAESVSNKAAPQIAIIIDDLGYNLQLGKRAIELDASLTLALLPYGPNSIELAELGHKSGKEIMLHAPMSAHHKDYLDEGGLTEDMDEGTFKDILGKSIDRMPYVKGVNNHMGSILTELDEPMSWLMDELKARRLFFIDSRTTPNSVASDAAQNARIPHLSRDVFLDNERNERLIKKQLVELVKIAERTGSAIGIGHPYPETIDALEDALPILKQYGIEVVPVSRLLPTRHPIPSVVFADLQSTSAPKPSEAPQQNAN